MLCRVPFYKMALNILLLICLCQISHVEMAYLEILNAVMSVRDTCYYNILHYCTELERKKTQQLQSCCKIEGTEDHSCKISDHFFWHLEAAWFSFTSTESMLLRAPCLQIILLLFLLLTT